MKTQRMLYCLINRAFYALVSLASIPSTLPIAKPTEYSILLAKA